MNRTHERTDSAATQTRRACAPPAPKSKDESARRQTARTLPGPRTKHANAQTNVRNSDVLYTNCEHTQNPGPPPSSHFLLPRHRHRRSACATLHTDTGLVCGPKASKNERRVEVGRRVRADCPATVLVLTNRRRFQLERGTHERCIGMCVDTTPLPPPFPHPLPSELEYPPDSGSGSAADPETRKA